MVVLCTGNLQWGRAQTSYPDTDYYTDVGQRQPHSQQDSFATGQNASSYDNHFAAQAAAASAIICSYLSTMQCCEEGGIADSRGSALLMRILAGTLHDIMAGNMADGKLLTDIKSHKSGITHTQERLFWSPSNNKSTCVISRAAAALISNSKLLLLYTLYTLYMQCLESRSRLKLHEVQHAMHACIVKLWKVSESL